MLRRSWTGSVLLVVLMLVFSACGGTPTATAPPPTAAPSASAVAAASAIPAASVAPTATRAATVAATTAPSVPAVAAATATVAQSAATPAASAVGSPTRAASPAAATPAASGAPPVPTLPVTVKDKDKKSVTITDVSRIIPLNGDIAEIIFALGLGKNVIATDTSATYPPEAAALPKIGYQRTLSAEGVLALKPTVIIGGETAGSPEVLEQLRGAGVPVVIIASPSTLDAAVLKIRATGAALGIPAAAEQLATKTQQEIDGALALAAKATSKPVVMFLYVRGATTQQIGGRGSSADTLILAAGGIDAGTAAGINGFKPLTAEAIVTGKPEVFLLLTAGLQSVGGVNGLLQIPGVAQTPAGQSKRVLDYEDQYLLGLGPRLGQALRELVLGLHPELR